LALTRIAFRFAFVYLTLYALATQLLGGVLIFPGVALPALGTVWPMRNITFWVAEHVFGLMPPLDYRGTSGDTAFHWVQTFWILIVAIAVTAAWLAWDRLGPSEGRFHDRRARRDGILHTWFRLFLRFALARAAAGPGARRSPTRARPTIDSCSKAISTDTASAHSCSSCRSIRSAC
jgi:hypothetical protein